MPPKKLSDSDKQEILDQYRNSDETTVTLAVQYNVSTSTVSRFLKQYLAEPEYEALVQKKRSGGRSQAGQETLPGLALPTPQSAKPRARKTPAAEAADDLEFEPLDEQPDLDQSQRRQRKRSGLGFISAEQLAASAAHLSQLEQAPPSKGLHNDSLIDFEPDLEADEFDPDELDSNELDSDELETELEPIRSKPAPKLARPLPVRKSAAFAEEEEEEEEEDLEDDLDDLDEEDLDQDLDDDEDEDLDDDDSSNLDSMSLQPGKDLQILPLQETSLPRICYVVVDRSSELITRPLKEFAELGQISGQETQEKTLPIFDNHRVAKRFLRRMQRIVKVPDGRVFEKVKPYLQAKGITHLLIDGQIYSLQ